MPRAENRTVRSEYDRTDIGLITRSAEGRDQVPHMRRGKRVPPLRRFMVMVAIPAAAETCTCPYPMVFATLVSIVSPSA
jgi:hypothetical protein